MKLILGNPGSGKTKEVLALSEKNNIPLLCESEARKQRLLVKARGYGFNNIPTPITFGELTPAVKAVYIDDIERVMEVAFNVKVAGLALNRDDSFELQDLDKK